MERGGKVEDDEEDLFVDSEFPADDSALLSDSSTPICKLKDSITWLRPQEICQSPELFPEDISLGHAKQGLLGDCWLLCACTILLQNKHLLNKVIPLGQPLWALLEKAYAKLHGSYERLWAGQVSEALVDLTGGLAEHWSLRSLGNDEDHSKEQKTDLVRRKSGRALVKLVKDNCLLACSTNSRPAEEASELSQYHALNVLECVEVSTTSEQKVNLLRIRNPWGRCCWDGSWIEGGHGWSTLDPLCAMGLKSRISQGEFWLDEEEFVSMFDDVTVGYQVNQTGHLKSIYSGHTLTHQHQLTGEWKKGSSAGGSRNSNRYSTNPKYCLKVRESGEVLVSLLQHKDNKRIVKSVQNIFEDLSICEHQHYHAIALHIWKLEKKRFNLNRVLNKAPFASTHCHAYDREVVLHQELQTGYYLMIPSTYQLEAEAQFLIRVFSSSSTSLSTLESPALPLPLTIGGEWDNNYFQGVCGDIMESTGVNIKITLRQTTSEKDLYPIGFHIYKAQDGMSESRLPVDDEPVASCVPHCYNQVVFLMCHLHPGVYTIVPSTYEPDCPANFSLCISSRVHRKIVKCQEKLGKPIKEISCTSLMQN
uniref:Calpain catalytic domain-containing protein n=1 Tax=Knipowitschia caucasica TaxID=637954 RepID=A0AAV2JT46_KNICA